MLSVACENVLGKTLCDNEESFAPVIFATGVVCIALFYRCVCSQKSSPTKPDRTIVVVLGHPGAGKGTFAQALSNQKFLHISLGDYLRSEFQKKSDIGLRWKKEVDTNGILAIEVVQEVTANLLRTISEGTPQTYILDGHVRLLRQAEELNEFLGTYKNVKGVFVYIDVSKEECLKRIPNRRTCEKCQRIYNLVTSPPKKAGDCDVCDGHLIRRNTDNEEMGHNRIETYASHLDEVVKYYKSKGVLSVLDGTLSIEECMENYRKFFVEHV